MGKGKGDVLGLIPFGSIIGAVCTCLGVILFCATLYTALDLTLRGIFEDLFLFRVSWLETLQILLIVIAVIVGLYSILLAIFGFLATGATRGNLYSGVKCIMGGRVAAIFFLTVTFIGNCIWVVVTSAVGMVVIIFAMLWSVCVHEIENKPEWYYETFCLNLSRFGIYRNYTENVDKNALCDETDLDIFCKHVKDATPFYCVAFGGSLLMVIGLVIFLITLTINYHKIKVSKEMTEYRDAVDMELENSTVIETVKHEGYMSSNFPSSYS